MHPESLAIMRQILTAHLLPAGATVLDVGSYNVNGTYRPLVESCGYRYTGLDMQAGPNVDIVAHEPYRFPVADASYAAVISGQTLEHVQKTWLFLPELARVLQPGGLLALITHYNYPEHRYPVDCWRFLPDGMQVLLDEAGCLTRYSIYIGSAYDIVAIAYKEVG
jgi:SAM-dependent methyltransferase